MRERRVALTPRDNYKMDLGALLETHGYWLLVVGCLLEGETILLLAGFAAHRGYLQIEWVVGLAAAAGFAGDLFYFWLGRRHGLAVLSRWPRVTRHAGRVQQLIDRYHAWVIIGVRFAYGLRVAGPIVIGTTSIGWARFVAFNAVGAILWAALIAGLGWVFGHAAETLLGEIRHLEGWLLLTIAVASAALWWWRRR